MRHWYITIMLSVVGGWALAALILLAVIELSDGKAFDSTWL